MEPIIDFLSDPASTWFFSMLQSFLIFFGFTFAIRQIRVSNAQNSIEHLNFFRNQWNSDPLLHARYELCQNPGFSSRDLSVQGDIVASFFEDLGIAWKNRQVNGRHTYSFFSWHIEGYWAVLKHSMEEYRAETDDPTFYRYFEDLAKNCMNVSILQGAPSPFEKSSVDRFLEEEMELAEYFLNSRRR